jgi:acetyl-CoA acyltransferase
MMDGGVKEAVIVGAVRTPLGKQGGVLSPIRPDDLAALVLEALMERTGVPPEEIEDVYMGCANGAGEDNRNVARMSLLLAGFPVEVAGATVNRLWRWQTPPGRSCSGRPTSTSAAGSSP